MYMTPEITLTYLRPLCPYATRGPGLQSPVVGMYTFLSIVVSTSTVPIVVYYESRKRELKKSRKNEYRCDERLKTKTEESTLGDVYY